MPLASTETSRPGEPHQSAARVDDPYRHLVGVVARLSMARDLGTIMAIVRRAARELTGADGATFVLRDGDLCYYADEDAIQPLWKGQRFPIDHCISGWAMRHGTAAIVTDIFTDERIPLAAYEPTFVRSVVMVPIRSAAPVGAVGTYWSRNRIPDPGEVAVLQALADTTSVALENVQVYQELESRVRERTAALESFTAAVSHDLRAPVRQIEMFAGMLLENHETTIPEGCASGLRTIAHEAGQVGEMADALLALSRMADLELVPQPIDLAALARSIAVEIRVLHSHPVEFVAPERLMVAMDPALARIALANLLGNAWKFSARVDAARVELGALPSVPGEPLVCFVRDNGAGFDGENASSLFGLFRRMHRQRDFPGTGVGLATVQRVIRRHGGRIWATSRVGDGATFYFTANRPGELPAS